jgi:hypothetical protein
LWHKFRPDNTFFERLDEEDGRVAKAVKAGGCGHCGGRLDRADYPRKPRGGEVGAGGEAICRRRSFCCAREGCRRRTTPPSLVFLGRRVYLALAILVESARAAFGEMAASPPRRTVRRWLGWFRDELPSTAFFAAARARVMPAVETQALPAALIDRFAQLGSMAEIFAAVLRFLSPLSAPKRRAGSVMGM